MENIEWFDPQHFTTKEFSVEDNDVLIAKIPVKVIANKKKFKFHPICDNESCCIGGEKEGFTLTPLEKLKENYQYIPNGVTEIAHDDLQLFGSSKIINNINKNNAQN